MNELISIQQQQIGDESVNSVDARELHSRLGVSKDFTAWVKYNIKKLNLIEDVDYLLTKKGEQLPSGMKYVSEYIFTMDCGKHVAMMTNTAAAHSVRTYFIEFEKRAKAALTATVALPSDPVLAQIAVLQAVREKQLALESGVQVLALGVAEARHEVSQLKQNMKIENWQQYNIQQAAHAKAAAFKDQYPHTQYSDLIRKIWRWFKKKFNVPRYNELPAVRYDEGLKALTGLGMHNLAGL
jgi:phage anti-repressor protein